MKRLVARILEALKGMSELVAVMLGEGKTSGHAVLTNFSSIQGAQNKKFQEDLAFSYSTLKLVVELTSKISS